MDNDPEVGCRGMWEWLTMDVTLLRNLGVKEAIIQALKKSYGEEHEALEILQDKHDLRLLLKRKGCQNIDPHILTLPGFFKKNTFAQKMEVDNAPLVEFYNCKDTLEFLAESSKTKENLKINGIEMRLSDALLNLLRYLAQKIVDTKTGWVYIQDMKKAKVIPSDGYQSFSRLRSSMAGYLLKKNANQFIEASGRKQYRLSIDPKNIKFPVEDKL